MIRAKTFKSLTRRPDDRKRRWKRKMNERSTERKKETKTNKGRRITTIRKNM